MQAQNILWLRDYFDTIKQLFWTFMLQAEGRHVVPILSPEVTTFSNTHLHIYQILVLIAKEKSKQSA